MTGLICVCGPCADGDADTITTTVPTKEFLKQACPNVPITREMGEWEAPLSNRKIREVLGFKEEHNWRQYYKP